MPEPTIWTAPSANGRSPTSPLHVVAADADPAVCQSYVELLDALGHEVLVARDGRSVADLCRAVRPDVLIADAVPPGWDATIPVIVVSADPPPDGLGSPDGPVLAYLGRPVHPAALWAAVAAAARLRALRSEVADLRQQLEDRKVIERAKGLVARYCGLGEEDAYTRMRKMASDQNRKLVEVARDIIAAAQVFQALEQAGGHRPAATMGHAAAPRTDHRPTRPMGSLTCADHRPHER